MSDTMLVCYSSQCTGFTGDASGRNKYVIKDVPKSLLTCPDCNYALRTIKKKNYRHFVKSRQTVPLTKKDFSLN